jgi:hypothetical protein
MQYCNHYTGCHFSRCIIRDEKMERKKKQQQHNIIKNNKNQQKQQNNPTKQTKTT